MFLNTDKNLVWLICVLFCWLLHCLCTTAVHGNGVSLLSPLLLCMSLYMLPLLVDYGRIKWFREVPPISAWCAFLICWLFPFLNLWFRIENGCRCLSKFPQAYTAARQPNQYSTASQHTSYAKSYALCIVLEVEWKIVPLQCLRLPFIFGLACPSHPSHPLQSRYIWCLPHVWKTTCEFILKECVYIIKVSWYIVPKLWGSWIKSNMRGQYYAVCIRDLINFC